MKKDESSSDDSDVESDSSDEESNNQPVLQLTSISHYGTVNRIRVMILNHKYINQK